MANLSTLLVMHVGPIKLNGIASAALAHDQTVDCRLSTFFLWARSVTVTHGA